MGSFHEIRFPTNISYGSSSAPRFSTEVITLRSGAEERVARWSYPLHVYNVRYGIRSYADATTVKDFFIRRLGPAHGFRYRDPLDFTTEANPTLPQDFREGSTPTFLDVQIATGDGTTTAFQLVKKYTDAVVTRNRNITKPVNNGLLRAGYNGTQGTENGAGAFDFTVNYTTGVITFNTAPASGNAITAGFEFDVPVRFSDELDDGLVTILASFGGGDLPDIPLLEELQPGSVANEFYYGGSANLTFGTSVTISANTGRAIRLVPSTTGLSVALPDETELQVGGPWFFLINDSANSVDINDNEGMLIFTLGANAGATVVLIDIGGIKTWRAF